MKQKISFIFKNSEGEISEELIWGRALDNGFYSVTNIPFYISNIAFDDIISVEKEDDKYYFLELIEVSGNSTIQIVFFEKNHENEIIKSLELMGCNWEGIEGGQYYAIDIPFEINYSNVKSFLSNNSNILDYKEACLSEKHFLEIN